MKARNLLLTMVAAALVLAPTAAIAQSAPGGRHDGGTARYGHGGGNFSAPGAGHGLGFFERMLPRIADRIGLSVEQMVQIEALIDESRPTIEGYVEQLEAGRESYRAENSDPTIFDEGSFRAHAQAQHEIQIELKVAVEKTKTEIHQLLTAEQREQLEEMRSERGERQKRHSGGRRGH